MKNAKDRGDENEQKQEFDKRVLSTYITSKTRKEINKFLQGLKK